MLARKYYVIKDIHGNYLSNIFTLHNFFTTKDFEKAYFFKNEEQVKSIHNLVQCKHYGTNEWFIVTVEVSEWSGIKND